MSDNQIYKSESHSEYLSKGLRFVKSFAFFNSKKNIIHYKIS